MGSCQAVFGGHSSSEYEYPGTSGVGLLVFGHGGGYLREGDQNLGMPETREKFGAADYFHKLELAGSGGYYRLHLSGSEGNHVLDSYGCRFLGSDDREWVGLRDYLPEATQGFGDYDLSLGYDSFGLSGY